MGEYELLLTGSSTGDPEFEAFDLSFDVLVARGAQVEDAQTEDAQATVEAAGSSTAEPTSPVDMEEGGSSPPVALIGILILGVVIGSVAYLILKKKV